MANIRSAAKRARQSDKKRDRNRKVKSQVKTTIKRLITSIEQKNVDAARKAFLLVSKELHKAAEKKVLPLRRASRKLSRLTLYTKSKLPEALQAKPATKAN